MLSNQVFLRYFQPLFSVSQVTCRNVWLPSQINSVNTIVDYILNLKDDRIENRIKQGSPCSPSLTSETTNHTCWIHIVWHTDKHADNEVFFRWCPVEHSVPWVVNPVALTHLQMFTKASFTEKWHVENVMKCSWIYVTWLLYFLQHSQWNAYSGEEGKSWNV